MKREFKYYPEDFGVLSVKVVHMDLLFDIFDDHTKVHSEVKFKTLNKSISKLELDANNLEISNVSCNISEMEYDYLKDKNKLMINFSKKIPANTEFVIKTENVVKPTKNILEGLYYDETPKGKPPTQITQCQQWGFQRLVPCIDDMTAKCTYRTRIIADKKYTHLITNGDVIEERKSSGNGRDTILYDNTKTPMSSYLFFLGVGSYDCYTREFEYPDGDKFLLELLVSPGADKNAAEKALDVLYHSVMWIYLFTGKDTYKDLDLKERIYNLVKKKDGLRKGKECDEIKTELKKLVNKITPGYKYTGTKYREIGMQNSNFGGMENVGNTTLTMNRIMPFKDMTDGAFEYMIRVKVHEYYHNINGSEVTGRSPFEIWLNEAVTVHIETKYLSYLMGNDYVRLERVLSLLNDGGTFDEDTSARSMPVEPDGFNNPDELITGMTYIKAPEFVRMIEQMVGEENFVKGLALYHDKFKHSNATRNDWIEAMEKVSGIKLKKMAELWLKQTGYPTVHIKTKFDKHKYTIQLEQKGEKFWILPMQIALVDSSGKDISCKLVVMDKKKLDVVFENVQEPAFVSLSRGYSFYGKVEYEESLDDLYLRVKLDSDIINRYMAFYKISDIVKMKLLKDKNSKLDERFIDLYYSLLSDEKLCESMGTSMLVLFDSVEDEKYAHMYEDLYQLREKILKSVALKYEKELLQLYKKYSNKKREGTYTEVELRSIKDRQVKNTCLGLLSRLEKQDVYDLIKKQYESSEKASDRMVGFSLYLKSKAKDKLKLLDKHEEIAKKNLVSWESFLASVSRNESDDALDIIKRVEKSASFRIEQSNDQRALYAIFSANKRKSLLTLEGRNFVKDVMIKLAPINEYNTLHVLEAFGKLDYLDGVKSDCVKVLVDVLKTLDKDKTPSVYNNVIRILKNSKKATKAYENEYGKISAL